MNNQYEIGLQKGSRKLKCVSCHQLTFKPYVVYSTGEIIHETVGRCDREDKCNYHRTPKQYFDINPGASPIVPRTTEFKPTPAKPLFKMSIDEDVNPTLQNYGKNSFVKGCINKIGEQATIEQLIRFECVGTSLKHPEAVMFWQISHTGTPYTSKIMRYDVETLKRDKSFFAWSHTGRYNEATHERKSCLFGSHLSTLYPDKSICITEAEKTAFICSHFMPQFNWMAAGNINGLTAEKLEPLKGKEIILFPDLGKGYEVWEQKANEFKHIAKIKVSQYLKSIATPEDVANGSDLADVLLRK